MASLFWYQVSFWICFSRGSCCSRIPVILKNRMLLKFSLIYSIVIFMSDLYHVILYNNYPKKSMIVLLKKEWYLSNWKQSYIRIEIPLSLMNIERERQPDSPERQARWGCDSRHGQPSAERVWYFYRKYAWSGGVKNESRGGEPRLLYAVISTVFQMRNHLSLRCLS